MHIWWGRRLRKLLWSVYRQARWTQQKQRQRHARTQQQTRDMQREEEIQRVYSPAQFEAYKRGQAIPPNDNVHPSWTRPESAKVQRMQVTPDVEDHAQEQPHTLPVQLPQHTPRNEGTLVITEYVNHRWRTRTINTMNEG